MKKILFIALLTLCTSIISYGKGKSVSAEVNDSLEQVKNDEHVKDVVKSMDEYLRGIAKEEAQNELNSSYNERNNISSTLDSFQNIIIPIFGIVIPFAMVCIVVYIIFSNETKRRRMKYNMVEKAIEHGQQLPEYIFYSQSKEKQKNSTLNSSIILIAVGFALTMFFIVESDYEVAALLSMIFLIGIGRLIVYILDQKKQTKDEANQSNNEDNI